MFFECKHSPLSGSFISNKRSFLRRISNRIFLFSLAILISFGPIQGEETDVQARKTSKREMGFHPYPQEGYFQAWNYSFTDEQTWIFATFIISNLGPGTRNCGVSLVIYDKLNGTRFFTKEFSEEDLKVENGNVELEIYNNSVSKGEHGPEIKIDTESAQLSLNYSTGWGKAISLSGGKIELPEKDKFVQADIAFSVVPVQGYLILDGNKMELRGKGGMEHLLTNYEVYKFSKRWELYRSRNNTGERLFTGGFIGNDSIPGGEIRTVSVMADSGKLLFSSKVFKSEILESEIEPFSNYELPIKEKFFLNEQETCSLTVSRKQTIGQISVLSNISSVLRFFVRLFFTKPYQLYYITESKLECDEAPHGTGTLPKDKIFKGIFSYYLINP